MVFIKANVERLREPLFKLIESLQQANKNIKPFKYRDNQILTYLQGKVD